MTIMTVDLPLTNMPRIIHRPPPSESGVIVPLVVGALIALLVVALLAISLGQASHNGNVQS